MLNRVASLPAPTSIFGRSESFIQSSIFSVHKNLASFDFLITGLTISAEEVLSMFEFHEAVTLVVAALVSDYADKPHLAVNLELTL